MDATVEATRRYIGETDVRIGASLRSIRTGRGVSLQWLGDQIGLTYQQIQKYETGANRLSVSTLIRIATALGVDPRDILADAMGVAQYGGDRSAAVSKPSDIVVHQVGQQIQQLPPELREQLCALIATMARTVDGRP